MYNIWIYKNIRQSIIRTFKFLMEKVNQLINNNFEIREDIWDYFIFNKIDTLKTKK